ncbi:MAG: serine dehydratase subunit alpha family protein [Ruminococcaceae bacterium]|nr:serine dehydratase subunit alpha family protein [Oscillospiraceae bacterium]
MKKTPHYQEYLQILEEELLPAMGCTEPISIALAAAKARELLGATPERVVLEVSGNIIKNVKSVVVPNTGGLKGMEAAAAVGITAGRADLGLEVLSHVTREEAERVKAFLEQCEFTIQPNRGGKIFYIRVDLSGGGHTASCEITDFHTNLTLLVKDGEVIFRGCGEITGGDDQTDRSVLSVQEIVDFINCVDPKDLRPTVGRQIQYNTAISQEGMTGKWGAAIGRTIRQIHGENDLAARASAAAAAGSDARMSGCEMPVIIVSGSGNQGMTASLPVIEYANALGASEEQLLRAVALSDLITIHQKTPIGRLSAFCGAVSAGVGAATGVAYLHGGDFKVIAHTIANALAICSGMICDGAKPSCAAKIASAVDAGLIGYHMYLNGNQFRSGEGIIKKGVENTIDSVGRLARMGMRETDNEILDIMVGN